MWILPRTIETYRGLRWCGHHWSHWWRDRTNTRVSRTALGLWPGTAYSRVTEARVATNQAKQEQCKSPSSHACMLATCACILLVCPRDYQGLQEMRAKQGLLEAWSMYQSKVWLLLCCRRTLFHVVRKPVQGDSSISPPCVDHKLMCICIRRVNVSVWGWRHSAG